jgi:hypothetical protein
MRIKWHGAADTLWIAWRSKISFPEAVKPLIKNGDITSFLQSQVSGDDDSVEGEGEHERYYDDVDEMRDLYIHISYMYIRTAHGSRIYIYIISYMYIRTAHGSNDAS